MGASSGAILPAAVAARAVSVERLRGAAPSQDRVVPVLEPLASLFPDGGLRRGSIVRVDGDGATSLAFGLVAAASGAGAWVGCAGLDGIGLQAVRDLGVALHRLVVVRRPGSQWATVVGALLDGMECVVVAPPAGARPADGRRLTVRVRDRGAVLVALGRGAGVLEAQLTVRVRSYGWSGLDAGAGCLLQRTVEVEASGRGAAARPRRVGLVLPGPDGALATPISPVSAAIPLRGAAGARP
jgi:hypothetical protein